MLRFHLLAACSALSLAIASVTLSGCGMQTTAASTPVANAAIKGSLYGGQQPVTGATITVWAMGDSGYGSAATSLATQTTDENGSFSFPANSYTCNGDGSPEVFITGSGGYAKSGLLNPNILLAAGLGSCTTAQNQVVNINEVTTAVTAFALGQFFGSDTSSFGAPQAQLGLLNSNEKLIPTLVDLPSGTVQSNVAASGDQDGITIEGSKIYTIANVLAACMNDGPSFSHCNQLFADTTPPGGSAPTNTLQAAVNMSLYPYQNVSDLFSLSGAVAAPFSGLSSAPNDWTVAVAYTTNSFGMSVPATTAPGSVSIDIDPFGDIWFPVESATGAGIGVFPIGFPGFFGPFATGPATQPQYVAADVLNNVFFTDGAGPSFVVVSNIDGSLEYTEQFTGAATMGPIAVDLNDNTYFGYTDASGNYLAGSVYLAGGGSPTDAPAAGTLSYAPSGIMTTPDGSLLFSTGGLQSDGGAAPCALEYLPNSASVGEAPAYPAPSVVTHTTQTPCISGGIAFATEGDSVLSLASSAGQFCSTIRGCEAPTVPLNQPEGIATDGAGNEWIANAADGSVSTFGQLDHVTVQYSETSPVAYLHGDGNGGTASKPYAIAIDNSGNIWLANASCMACATPSSFTLTEIIGAAAPPLLRWQRNWPPVQG